MRAIESGATRLQLTHLPRATIAKGFRKAKPGEQPDPKPYAIKRFTVVGAEAAEKLLEVIAAFVCAGLL